MQCALPAETLERVVELMLGLLGCGYDPARKNAVLFFGAALHFRAVLAVFDSRGGLAKVLDCLQTVLMLLHGQQDLKAEKQVRCCCTLSTTKVAARSPSCLLLSRTASSAQWACVQLMLMLLSAQQHLLAYKQALADTLA